jgi:hypothetical protein
MTEQAYRARIKQWIDAALLKKRLSLNELIRHLPGVHPTIVAEHVSGDDRIAEPTTLGRLVEPVHTLRFPVPHPLDYDWRFTESSRDLLLQRALSLTGSADHVILLGAPTVFRAAVERQFPRRITLVDSNGYIGGSQFSSVPLNVITADITQDAIPCVTGELAITDPPWYEEYSRAFLWAAAQIVQSGGTVLLSAAPAGTRPGIEEEWERTKEFASTIGLEFISAERVLRYRMPPFELNALRAAGHFEVEHDWRPGMLWTFSRTESESSVVRPYVPSTKNEWLERCVSGVRFRVRQSFGETKVDPRLENIVPGDVLDSVSRRDSRRNEVEVWTSGNRIFRCTGTSILVLVLDAIAMGKPAAQVVAASLGRMLTDEERHHIRAAENHVIDLVHIETEEYVNGWEG